MESFAYTDELMMDPCCTLCQECGEEKTTPKQLYGHLFAQHSYDKSRIEIIKQGRRSRSTYMKALRKSKLPFICKTCGKPFLSKSGLMLHKQNEHDTLPPGAARIPCPQLGCEFHFTTYIQLATHADVEHRYEVTDKNSFRIYRKQFSSVKDMQKWRAEKERETDTRFVMRSSASNFRYGKRVTMWYCASGYSRKKNVSRQPCPAFMRIYELQYGIIDVVACFGHLGHPHSTVPSYLLI